MKIVATILFLLIAIGCDLQNNEDHEAYYERPARVNHVEILGLANKKIEFNVFAVVPSPCNYYSKTELKHDKNDYYVKIFSSYDGEPCIAILSTIEVPISVNVPSGEKIFHFWQSDTSYLDTTIRI